MKGIVLKTQLVREEDKIVSILTNRELLTLYRFYGARHSSISVGYFLDFNVEYSPYFKLGRLRDVIELPFPQLWQLERFLPWERFCGFLYSHLAEVTLLPSFYYTLMEKSLMGIEFQQAERVLISAYWKILKFEGRLPFPNSLPICPFCNKTISKSDLLSPIPFGIDRELNLYHPNCVYSLNRAHSLNPSYIFPTLPGYKGLDFLETGKTILLSDKEIRFLFNYLF